MRIALIGDIHLYSLKLHPRRMLSKRVMGHTNLIINRYRRFNHGLLPHLTRRVLELEPEMVLLSGDVTTTSLEDEFQDVARYLKPITDAVPTVLVPGNHDRYTFGSRRDRRIERLMSPMMPEAFPHIRPLTPGWKLLALDAAIPNKVLSRGALGDAQYEQARELVQQATADEALLVMCHYPCALPPRFPRSWAHDLREATRLKKLLTDCPARVVHLHGHIHKPWRLTPDGQGRPPFECINAGSPCYTSERFPLGQGFWMLDVPDAADGELVTEHHEPMPADGQRPRSTRPGDAPPTWRVQPKP